MLARYPKVEPISTDCNVPHLCFLEDSKTLRYNHKYIPSARSLSTRCGSHSAPVLDQNSSFNFVLENSSSRYPKQALIDQKCTLVWYPSILENSSFIEYEQITNDSSSEADFIQISRCLQLLYESCFYYEGLSWQQASVKLRRCRVGTFLIRESENANFLFTLSVQTRMGPTSIRIAYQSGQFRLDADEELAYRMPMFSFVTDLVEYYIRVSQQLQPMKNADRACCWLDLAGECAAPVELYRPLYKNVLSLKHLSRLSLFKQMWDKERPLIENCISMELPVPLWNYLANYPYCQ